MKLNAVILIPFALSLSKGGRNKSLHHIRS
jgi:hypothetical protein